MEIKEDVLKCTTAELGYGLCRFICEVKRPNGESYSQDSLFYLCLGIQQVGHTHTRSNTLTSDDIILLIFASPSAVLISEWAHGEHIH